MLLGSAEIVGDGGGRFEPIDKTARLYWHVGGQRPGDLDFAAALDRPWMPDRPVRVAAESRQAMLAALCRQAVLDAHAPAALQCNLACVGRALDRSRDARTRSAWHAAAARSIAALTPRQRDVMAWF